MPSWLKRLWPAARFCADCALSFACWTLWLALGAALVVQVGIAVSNELSAPAFLLRSFEQGLAASHVNARFGRAVFDPTGRIVLENLQLSLPEFSEPVVNARAVFIELDPWSLLAGKFEPRRIQATGVNLFVPAMLAPSGRSEESISDLEFSVALRDRDLAVEQLTAHVVGVALDLHGTLQLPRAPAAGGAAPLPLLETLALHYAEFSRQLIRASEQLAAFDQPQLHATLVPSQAHGAVANVVLIARSLKLPRFRDLQVTELRVTTRLPLIDDAPSFSIATVEFDEARIADGAAIRGARARVRGRLDLAKLSYSPREIELFARDLSARGFTLEFLSAKLDPGPLSKLRATLLAECAGSPLALSGRADFAEKTAALDATGALAPALLEPIDALIGRDLRPFIGFGEPVAFDLGASFAAGWKFEKLSGRVAARRIDAHGVAIDSAGGEIEFDGRRFVARHALARLGGNFARGSFEQNLVTREYRFLLEGRLRPLDISGWFHEWWPKVFRHFDFPVAPPDASVDVLGRWRAPQESAVFVFADSAGAVIRSVQFDHARTLLFIRPNLIDGLEVFGTHGAGDVRGTFTRNIDVTANDWNGMDLAVTSTFPLDLGVKLLGPALAERLEPFTFEQPPRVTVSGHLDGPAARNGEHQNLHIEAQSTGGFSLYGFPARNLSFDATLKDDNVQLHHVEASVAGGTLSGNARLTGRGTERRLAFDAALRDAKLAQAVSIAAKYAAQRRGQPAVAPGKFIAASATTTLDVGLTAEGRFADPFSFHGNGTAILEGKELGEVRLLGLLSELFNFTALRFTGAHADFKLDGAKLDFPAFSVTGANSAIEAHGTYALDRHALDFNARVYPFRESKSVLQIVGAVLSPLSTALEVKLTGPLDQPKWAFVIGPTNLFRSLAQPSPTPESAQNPATEPSPYLKRK